MNTNMWTVKRIGLGGISSIDLVFNKLEEIYQEKWTARFKNNVEDWKEVWAVAFQRRDLTFGEVDNGLLACQKFSHRDIDLVTFLDYCRPSENPECAYQAALKSKPAKVVKKERRRSKDKEREVTA